MTRHRLFKPQLLGALLVLGTAWPLCAAAATQYVSDELSINMRSGAGTQYKIQRLLDAGDKLEVLGTANGWTHVRTPAGQSGYVLTRFLSDSPAASAQLGQIQQQSASLTNQNAELKQELSEALDGSSELGELKRNLVTENKSLKAELQKIRETSADAIRISNENEQYREQIIQLKANVDRLKHQNEALRSRREGMKIGALIAFGGILIGLVAPMLRRRRRGGSWDSL